MNTQNIVIALVIGLVAGWLASWVVGGSGGIIWYLIVGIVGSFVGSFILGKTSINLGISNEIARDIVTATIGAIIVVLLARFIGR